MGIDQQECMCVGKVGRKKKKVEGAEGGEGIKQGVRGGQLGSD